MNHTTLESKTVKQCIRGKAKLQLKSYLTNRTQAVKEVTCGIPQGRILGPIPFLTYINDFLFLIQNISADIERVNEWLKANKLALILNTQKNNYAIFNTGTTYGDIDIKVDSVLL